MGLIFCVLTMTLRTGSLLLLSSACKSAGIPLIVINDPRTKWNNRDRNNAEEEETFEEELFNAGRKCRERVKGDVGERGQEADPTSGAF